MTLGNYYKDLSGYNQTELMTELKEKKASYDASRIKYKDSIKKMNELTNEKNRISAEITKVGIKGQELVLRIQP